MFFPQITKLMTISYHFITVHNFLPQKEYYSYTYKDNVSELLINKVM